MPIFKNKILLVLSLSAVSCFAKASLGYDSRPSYAIFTEIDVSQRPQPKSLMVVVTRDQLQGLRFECEAARPYIRFYDGFYGQGLPIDSNTYPEHSDHSAYRFDQAEECRMIERITVEMRRDPTAGNALTFYLNMAHFWVTRVVAN